MPSLDSSCFSVACTRLATSWDPVSQPTLPGTGHAPPLVPRPHPVIKETQIHKAPPTGSGSTPSKLALTLHSRLRPQSQTTTAPLANSSALSQDSTLRSKPCPALKTSSSRTGPIYSDPSSRPHPKPCPLPLYKSPSQIHKTPPPNSSLTLIYKIPPQNLQSRSPYPGDWDSAS